MANIERASEFYARQGYDFGVDNLDVIRMLAEYEQGSLDAIAKTLRTWAAMHNGEGKDEAAATLNHAAAWLDELPY